MKLCGCSNWYKIRWIFIALSLLVLPEISLSQNLPPVLDRGIPNQHCEVDLEFSYTIPSDAFQDENGDQLAISASSLPSWLSFDSLTVTLSGTPLSAGKSTINITASDGSETASTSFSITAHAGSVYAAFTMDYQMGCGYRLVQFTNKSKGVDDNSYNWVLGNGNTSDKENPSAIFNQPGEYEVTLTINEGTTDKKSHTEIINIYPRPEPSVNEITNTGCEPFDINLQSTGSPVSVPGTSINDQDIGSIPGGSETYYNWYFFEKRDAIFTDRQSVNVDNLQGGIYKTILEVTDEYGCQGSKITYNHFEVYDRPDAKFTYNKTDRCTPSVTNFFDQSSIDNSTIANYRWKIDGSAIPYNSDHISYDFSKKGEGSYPVELQTESANGCESDWFVDTIVFNNQNTIDFATNSDYCKLDTVKLHPETSQGALEYQWTIDGNTVSNEESFNHVFNTSGIYNVGLQVLFNDGCTKSISKNITISQLVAQFSYQYKYDCNEDNFDVVFVDQTFSSNSQISSYKWYRVEDDEKTLIGNNATFTYPFNNDGDYQIYLEILNEAGCFSSITKTITLIEPEADILISGETDGCTPIEPTFTAVFQSPNDTIKNYKWNFGDGSESNGELLEQVSHKYSNEGNYTVSLEIETTNNCSYTKTLHNIINTATPPEITNVNIDNTDPCFNDGVDIEVEFTNGTDLLIFDTPSGTINEDVSGTSHTFTYHPNKTNPFEISVIASNNNCLSSSTETTNPISPQKPQAFFKAEQTTFCESPVTINFSNESDTTKTNNNSIFTWDFGDGSLVNNQVSPTHQYSSADDYNVTLTVKDQATGCTDTYSDSIFIYSINDDTIKITTDKLTGCAPHKVEFSLEDLEKKVSDNFFGKGFRCEWDFDDNIDTTTTTSFVEHTYTSPGKYIASVKIKNDDCSVDNLLFSDTIEVYGPIVNFSSLSPSNNICHDTPVSFKSTTEKESFDPADTSQYKYQWTFSDGIVNPADTTHLTTHTFSGDTIFNVALTVSDNNNCTATKEKVINIIPFTPEFFTNDTLRSNNEEVLFTNTSKGENLEYYWDFDGDDEYDDITFNKETTVTYLYKDGGVYKPTLTAVSTISGCQKKYSLNTNLRIINVTAGFEAEENDIGCAPAFAYFTPEAKDEDVVSYHWDFGDGNTSQERAPRNYYVTPTQDNDYYDVTLNVNYIGGYSISKTINDYIKVDGAYGVFNYDDKPACLPNKVTFYVSDMSMVDYISWDYGDGTVEKDTIENGEIATSPYEYVSGGYVTPRVILSHEVCGDYEYANENNPTGSIYNSTPPTANFITNYDSICKGVPIQFTDNSYSTDPVYNKITSWEWHFNSSKDETSNTKNPEFAYQEPGTFYPELIVSNELGCTDTIKKENGIAIYSNNSLSSEFDISDTLICPFQEITLSSKADAGGESTIKSYEWDFGQGYFDGSEDETHTFPDSLKGNRITIKHKVTDDKQCFDSTLHTVAINNLQAAFEYEPQRVFRGSPVDFTDTSETDFNTKIVNRQWFFENGTTQQPLSDKNVKTTFYKINESNTTSLIVINDNGCTNTLSVQFDIENNPPTLDSVFITLIENSSYPFTKNDFINSFHSNDDDAGQKLEFIEIAELPQNGILYQSNYTNGTVEKNDRILVNHLDSLLFIPSGNWHGTTEFSWNGSDGIDMSNHSAVVDVLVLKEPEPPILSDIIFNIPEDSIVFLTIDNFKNKMESELRNSFDFDSLIIETLPNNGKLYFNDSIIENSTLFTKNTFKQDDSLIFIPDHGFNGTILFNWTAFDGYSFAEKSAKVKLEYYNTPPVLSDITIDSLRQGHIHTFAPNDFLQNFYDFDRYDSITKIGFTNIPSNNYGKLFINDNEITSNIFLDDFENINTVEFRPDNSFEGEVNFTWNAWDDTHFSSATIKLTYINTKPELANVNLKTKEDYIFSFSLTDFDNNNNDSPFTDIDPEDSLEYIKILSLPENGILKLSNALITIGDSISKNDIDNLTYTPNADWYGYDSLEYNAQDGTEWAEKNAYIFIEVEAVNDAPRPNPNQYIIKEDTKLENKLVRINDIDIDDEMGNLSYHVAISDSSSAGKSGKIFLTKTGILTYTPEPDFYGNVSFKYTVCDDDSACAKTDVFIDVRPINDPPTPVNDTLIISESDIYSNINLLENDFDIDIEELLSISRIDSFKKPMIEMDFGYLNWEENGNVFISLSNQIDTLSENETLSYDINYTVQDDSMATSIGTLYVMIIGENNIPVSVNDTFYVKERFNIIASNDSIYYPILKNDYDIENDSLWIVNVNKQTFRSINTQYGIFNWHPDGDWEFIENQELTAPIKKGEIKEINLSYNISDGIDTCNTSIIKFVIEGLNNPPSAINDTIILFEDNVIDNEYNGNVLINDFDIENDSIWVKHVNNDTIKTIENQFGILRWNNNGDYTFKANESLNSLSINDSLIIEYYYNINDVNYAADSAKLSFIIIGENDKPTTNYSIIKNIYEDDLITMVDSTNGLLSNAFDIDGDLLIVANNSAGHQHSMGEHGRLTWEENGEYTYFLNESVQLQLSRGEIEYDIFQYKIEDPSGSTTTGTLLMRIIGKNDAPYAINDTIEIYENSNPITKTENQEKALLFNDSDINNDDFWVYQVNNDTSKQTTGKVGSLIWNNNGSFTYTPNYDTLKHLGVDHETVDTYTYQIKDEWGATDSAQLIIIIKGINDAPFAYNDSITIYEDTSITIVDSIGGLLSNDGDIDHDLIAVAAVNNEGRHLTTGDFGKLTWDSSGAFIYETYIDIVDTLHHGEIVKDIFSYQIYDPSGATDQADLHITIVGQNDGPYAIDHHDSLIEDDQTLTIDKRTNGMLAGDYDIDDNDNFGVVSVNESTLNIIKGTYGILEWQYDGTYHFTLNAETDTLAENEIVIDSFEYRIEDAYDSTAMAWFFIEITGNNDHPLALNDTLRIDEEITIISPSWPLLQNDSDVDGDSISLFSLYNNTTSPVETKFATFTWNNAGYFEYQRYVHEHKKDGLDTLAWNDVVYDSIPYSIIDTHNYESEAYLHLIIQGKNDAPITQRDTISLSETQDSISGNMLENDMNVDRGDYISLLTVNEENDFSTKGIFGTLTWKADGTFTYHNNFEATDSLYEGESAYEYFPYIITDKLGKTVSDTIEVTIIGENNTPVAAADTIYITESNLKTSIMPEREGILSNDFDVDGDSIKVLLPNNDEDSEFTGQFGTFYLNSNGQANYSLNAELDTLYSGEVVTEKFNYSISDTHNVESSSHIIFFITGENDNPEANNDFYSTDEDTDSIYAVSGIPGGILKNDSDIDKDSLFILSVNDSTSNSIEGYYGTITWQPDGSFTYYNNKEKTDPLAESDTVIQSFTYIASDPFEGTDSSQINIEIIGINDAPVARTDKFTTVEFKPLLTASPNIDDVLHNDSDIDGKTQTITRIETQTGYASIDTIYGEWGKLIWKTNGEFTYFPDTLKTIALRNEQLASDQYEYEIEDEFGATDTSKIQFIIQGINNIPIARDDTMKFYESYKDAYIHDIRKNDMDYDEGDTLRIGSFDYETDSVITGIYGEIYWNQNGEVAFTPNLAVINTLGPSEHIQEHYKYVVFDQEGASDTANVIVSITGENDPLTAINDSTQIKEDSYAAYDLIENDIDTDYNEKGNFDYSSLQVEIKPNHGEVSVNSANGRVYYIPDENFYGKDSLKYRICDLGSPVYCDTAWFIIDVTPVNDPPVANNLLLVTPKNTKIGFEAFHLFIDVDDGLDSTSLTIPEIETLNRINDSLIYTPVNNFIGIDEFTYSISDFDSATATSIVTIIVQDGDFRAQDDFAQTNENTGININILDNDTIGGVVNTFSPDIRVYPKNGTAIYDPVTHSIEYMPETDFYGTDSLQYIVASKDGEWDAAKVFIEVVPVNENIVANNDAVITRKNTPAIIAILDNDYDNDNEIDTSSVVIDHPDVDFNYETGMATYTPADGFIGPVTFEYSVCDNDPVNRTCGNASITVIVQSSFSDLTATNDSYSTPENQSISLDNPHPTYNDYDIEGENIDFFNSFTPITNTPTEHGSYEFDEETGIITYTPNENYFGLDWILYQICDDDNNCDIAEININVEDVNTPPVAVDDKFAVSENTQKRLYILNNDYDIDGELDWNTLDTVAGQGPRKGSVVFDHATGTILYEPSTNADVDEFMYTISDNNGESSTAIVRVFVDLGSTILHEQVTHEEIPDTFAIAPLLESYNLFFDVAEVSELNAPDKGQWEIINNNTQIVYTPMTDSTGSDFYNLELCSAGGNECADLKVQVTILNMNDAPVAVSDTVTWSKGKDSTIITFNHLLKNDYDIDSESIFLTEKVIETGDSLHVTFNADSTITIAADTILWCNAWFTYEIKDDSLAADTGMVYIYPALEGMVAIDDSSRVDENSVDNIIPVLDNDSVKDMQLCTIDTVYVTEYPQHGMAGSTSENNINYSPAADYYSPDSLAYTDSLQYTVIDMWEQHATAWVYIHITQRNTPPVAESDNFNVERVEEMHIPVLENDYDPDPDGFIDTTKTYLQIDSQPAFGSTYFDYDKGVFVYIPDVLSCSNDEFAYTIFDNEGDSASAVVNIIMPEEALLFANTDTVKTWPGVPVEFNVLKNDSGYFLPYVEDYTTPFNGSVSQTGDSTFAYYPSPDFVDKDSMTYKLISPCGNMADGKVILMVEELRVPEIITPNNDTKNDVLIIDGIQHYPNSWLRIFNRAGHVVYEKRGYENDWDGYSNRGSFGNNKPLPSGTYYYTLIYNEGRNRQAGFIYIFR